MSAYTIADRYPKRYTINAPHGTYELPGLAGQWKLIEEAEDGACFARPKLRLLVITSLARELDGLLWLHVSVNQNHALPSYQQLAMVKAAFIGLDRLAVQVFAPAAEHVNIHPHCLHLWSCLDGRPLPDFTRGTGSI